MVADRFVLDCSVTMAWCFAYEITEFTQRIRRSLADGYQALVPPHWSLEVTNTLLVAERRGRLQYAQVGRFLALLARLPISPEPGDADRTLTTVYPLARESGLSSYDGAYLELAVRTRTPLATLDQKLRTAAVAVNVKVLED